MFEPNLILVCVIAFATVMILLAFLAMVISGIMKVFPMRSKKGSIDQVLVAAINSVVSIHLPGARVTRIEEVL